MRSMQPRNIGIALLILIGLCLLPLLLYFVPPVHERLAWRVQNLRAQIKYFLDPPQEVSFTSDKKVAELAGATMTALTRLIVSTPTATSTIRPTATLVGPTETPTLTPAPTIPVTPLPPQVALTGIQYEYQKYNNCGPATLALALSYWGWPGNQTNLRDYLRPNLSIDDKNVSPYEMVDYVNQQTSLRAIWRAGGDLELVKRLIAAGFPVLIERGHISSQQAWMGHYQLLSGYDDITRRLIAQDTLVMPNLPEDYQKVLARWQDFNYLFVVVYPSDKEPELLSALGLWANEQTAYHLALEKALKEAGETSGMASFFAWFNIGSSRVGLKDYEGAAAAYDAAFSTYDLLPEADRPWRVLWYQHGPFESLYHTGRYDDLIHLANATLATLSEPNLEEAFYWAGMGRLGKGETDKARDDFKIALTLNPNYVPAATELQNFYTPTPVP